MLNIGIIMFAAFMAIQAMTIGVAIFQDPAELGSEIPELRDMACIEYPHGDEPSQFLCMTPDQLPWYTSESDMVKARKAYTCEDGICYNEDGTRLYSQR